MSKNITAKSITRPAPKRRIRACKIGAARQALAEFDRGLSTYILTFGQFSLIETLEAVLEKTGAADVAISTWTAAASDLDKAKAFLKSDKIKSLRFVVDCSFINRQPGFARELVEKFGVESIRTTRTHAKFITVKNNDWNVVIQTSMNLNENPRLENIDVTDDKDFCRFINSIVDNIFKEEEAGDWRTKVVPKLSGIEDMPLFGNIEMARGTVTMGSAGI